MIKTGQTITYKNLVLDINQKLAFIQGKNLGLTVKEYQILELLMLFPDQFFSKQEIHERIWGYEDLGDIYVLKTHVSNLRKRLRELDGDTEYIETVWGVGYRLAKKGEIV